MKKRFTLFLFISLLCSLVSWKADPFVKNLNISGWNIRIREKNLLSSDSNQMGDIVSIRKKTLKPTDFIHAERYLCGQSADNATTILTVKDNFNNTIKSYFFKNSSMTFGGDIPVKDLLNAFTVGETVSIYFTISSMEKDLNSSVLLGRLKLE